MRFYVVTLAIYSVAVTILAGLLMMQNRQLKTAGSQPQVDYAKVYEIDTQDLPMKGPEAAPVTIIEFNDFECQFCAKGHELVGRLMDEYPGQVRVGFKNLPLPFHDNARSAAGAALAAYRQGKFWEMEAKLFANQDRLGDELYLEIAQELGLDMDQFNAQRNPEHWAEYLQMQRQEAETNGVTGTPTFFVNGIKVQGVGYDALKGAVEFALGKAGS